MKVYSSNQPVPSEDKFSNKVNGVDDEFDSFKDTSTNENIKKKKVPSSSKTSFDDWYAAIIIICVSRAVWKFLAREQLFLFLFVNFHYEWLKMGTTVVFQLKKWTKAYAATFMVSA